MTERIVDAMGIEDMRRLAVISMTRMALGENEAAIRAFLETNGFNRENFSEAAYNEISGSKPGIDVILEHLGLSN